MKLYEVCIELSDGETFVERLVAHNVWELENLIFKMFEYKGYNITWFKVTIIRLVFENVYVIENKNKIESEE